MTPPRFDGLASPAAMSSSSVKPLRRSRLRQRLPRVGRIADRRTAPASRLSGRAPRGRRARARPGAPGAGPRGTRRSPPRALRGAGASMSVLPGGPRAELDARPLGEAGQRLPEVEPVSSHQEREDVACLAAAEAVPGLALGRDDERRRLLRVERTESLVDGPARLSATVSPTTSATGSFALISATMPEEELMAPPSRARSAVVKCFVKIPRGILPDCQGFRQLRRRTSRRWCGSVDCPRPHRTASRQHVGHAPRRASRPIARLRAPRRWRPPSASCMGVASTGSRCC